MSLIVLLCDEEDKSNEVLTSDQIVDDMKSLDLYNMQIK